MDKKPIGFGKRTWVKKPKPIYHRTETARPKVIEPPTALGTLFEIFKLMSR